ncbi:hypothetical protein Tco_0127223 [Tanacetum coccineum]
MAGAAPRFINQSYHLEYLCAPFEACMEGSDRSMYFGLEWKRLSDWTRVGTGNVCDQLEWVLWYAPWLSDQLEWVLWYAPWLSDQLEWICGMLHGLVINWSSSAIETSRNRVNDIQFSNLEELQVNQDENICYYYWENCFSILNANEADNTKPPLPVDTFGSNGGDDLETSGPVTPAEEVVDSGHSSTLSSLVAHRRGDASISYGDGLAVPGVRVSTEEATSGECYALVSERRKKEKGEVLCPS